MTFFVTTSIDEAIEASKRFSENARKTNQEDVGPEQLASEGIQRALEAASSVLIASALARLRELCISRRSINADDLSDFQLGNAAGAVFRLAVKNKWIRFSGQFIPSSTPSAHGRMIRLWESRLYPSI